MRTVSAARRLLENGNKIPAEMLGDHVLLREKERLRMYDEAGRFYGIYEYYAAEREARPVKMFLSDQ